MTLVPGITPEDREVFERLGFKVDVGYIEVPLCRWCKFWGEKHEGLIGRQCNRVNLPGSNIGTSILDVPIITKAYFGCIQYEPKDMLESETGNES